MSELFEIEQEKRKTKLREKLNRIGWGTFLIMLGIIWVIPKGFCPDGLLPLSIGIIFIALSLAKSHYKIRGSSANFFLGLIFLTIGLGDFFNLGFPIISVLLIFWGMFIIFRILFPKTGK